MDKRRKKKQKEQADDEAFLDNEQDDGDYEQGKSGQPSVPAYACLLEPSTLNHSNFDSVLTALPLLGFATELLYTLSAVPLAQHHLSALIVQCSLLLLASTAAI